MRKFIVIVFYFVSLHVFGQPNYIVRGDAIWSTLETHCMPGGNNYSTYHIKFSGDTLIEDLSYTQILRCDEEGQTAWELYGFIREDSDGRVFLRPADYMEGLIYDFGVEVGDSVRAKNIYLNSDTLHYIVTNIDYVELAGEYKKRISLYEYINEKEEIWIEGLGSYFGILNSCNNSYGGLCGNYEALCFEENGILIYQHPDYSVCHFEATVGTGEQAYNQSEVSVYPNPAKDFLHIDFSEDININNGVSIKLLKINGEKILQKNLANSKNVVYLHSVDAGIYLLKIDNIGVKTPIKIIFD
ncbi:MAG: T9SS type A sorting domain-containing protein [Bacteroidales bacterium]|nr:T9SS type A sorting domain-containing protein [Bacteroidales bacterium]MCF8403479.1 T9SS type A sorting domain-containing protein [Bacteroidales bacterium]